MRYYEKDLFGGHSSAGRAPAWHEAIKSINKA